MALFIFLLVYSWREEEAINVIIKSKRKTKSELESFFTDSNIFLSLAIAILYNVCFRDLCFRERISDRTEIRVKETRRKVEESDYEKLMA